MCGSSSCRHGMITWSPLLREDTIMPGVNTAVLGEMQVQSAIVPSLGKEHECKSQTGNQEHIQDTKEDKHLRDSNLIASVGKTKGDGVQKPKQIRPAC